MVNDVTEEGELCLAELTLLGVECHSGILNALENSC